jgi:adenylate kinase
MRIILLGPPGAGKGTQARFLSARYSIPLVTPGDLLRAAVQTNSALGRAAKAQMAAGQLVSDPMVIALTCDRLGQPDCQSGFLLDGFPRSLPQAQALKTCQIPIDIVLELDVPDETILQRLSGRRVHLPSGRSYHLLHHPPRLPDRDDITGQALVQREDDREETILKRLQVYRTQTAPLLDYYKTWRHRGAPKAPYLLRFQGDQDVKTLRDQILSAVSKIQAAP